MTENWGPVDTLEQVLFMVLFKAFYGCPTWAMQPWVTYNKCKTEIPKANKQNHFKKNIKNKQLST